MQYFLAAIYNFNEPVEYKLKLTVGDAVHLLEEEDNWYYGYILSNRTTHGIFPKNYIHIKQCIEVDLNGPTPEFVFKEPPLHMKLLPSLGNGGTLKNIICCM